MRRTCTRTRATHACSPGRLLRGTSTLIVATAAALLPIGAETRALCEEADRAPNIILILADDLGWAELGCYGNQFNETPQLDKLATEGMRFTDAYAAAPVCSPYRVSLIAGQYPARVGITDYLRPSDPKHLSTEHVTVAEMFKAAGYATGMIGKWHLTGYAHHRAQEVPPTEHGFDEAICSEKRGIGGGSYFHPYHFNPDIERRLPDEFLVDRVNLEAVDFIERHKDRPFFLYVSHYAVHTRMAGRPDLVAKYEKKPGAGQGNRAPKNNPHLAAQLESIDQGVGMVVGKLAELGLAERTVLIFTSDNGGEGGVTSNAPLRGAKSQLYEGGIREPLVVRYPGVVPAGSVCKTPVCSVDFYPTLLEICGLRPDPRQTLDGVSILPLLKDPGATLTRNTFYWHYPLARPHFLGGRSGGAIRHGDWKLIEWFDTGRLELYHLADDLPEQHNLAESQPERANQLHEKLRAWRKSVHAPMIPGARGDDFWAPKIKTCREVTLPYCFETCEKTGRISNFSKAAGLMEGKFEGIWFNDSDVYKVLEGAAYVLATTDDPKLDKLTDEVIAKIAAAQQPDGYLYCFFTIANADQRFKHICPGARHELYCMGHMIEAGAVHFEMTGKRNLLEVACKLADHVDSVFGPNKRHEVPEHQALELALIKLYRVTHQKRYLDLARFFIDQRGNAAGHKLYGAYSQDHEPVRRQSEIAGHSVRAMYHCTGMADLYLETGDEELLAACRRLWRSTTHRKMYVTGGVGATRHGEAFGADYELPNETAYAETCAAIGLIFFAHRMLQIEPDAEYADVLERVLYNGFLSGLSLSGDKFFYQNRLATRGDYRRQPWYGCACCPSNVVRVFPKIGRYVYSQDHESIYVNLYAGGSKTVKMKETVVGLTQQTRYPWDGNVKLTVDPDRERSFDLCLRIPGWCKDLQTPGGLYRFADPGRQQRTPILEVNGEPIDTGKLDRGYVRIRRAWKPGDVVELSLPMPIRRVYAHPNVKADAGRVAFERGPIVYCVEAVDHGGRVRHLVVSPQAKLTAEHRPDLLGGVTVITGKAAARRAGSDELEPVDLLAIPYYAWDNRAGGEMAVWLPEDPGLGDGAK